VAIVDINLRDGERANHLIDRLHEQRIPVVVITGYTEVALPPGKVEAILQKPVSVEKFLAILCPIIARQKER
jgi:FixJ family two-component response regulator